MVTPHPRNEGAISNRPASLEKVSRRKDRKVSALLSDTASPQLFEFLDRGAIDMPADYLPHAPGVMFAGEDILSAAGYIPGSNRPQGWMKHQPGCYRKRVGKHVLQVRQCGSARSDHWTIERVEPWADKGIEALVFSVGRANRFGPEPIRQRCVWLNIVTPSHARRSSQLGKWPGCKGDRVQRWNGLGPLNVETLSALKFPDRHRATFQQTTGTSSAKVQR